MLAREQAMPRWRRRSMGRSSCVIVAVQPGPVEWPVDATTRRTGPEWLRNCADEGAGWRGWGEGKSGEASGALGWRGDGVGGALQVALAEDLRLPRGGAAGQASGACGTRLSWRSTFPIPGVRSPWHARWGPTWAR